MHIVCTLLQTDNHVNTSSLNLLQAGCSCWRPSQQCQSTEGRLPGSTNPQTVVTATTPSAKPLNSDVQSAGWDHITESSCHFTIAQLNPAPKRLQCAKWYTLHEKFFQLSGNRKDLPSFTGFYPHKKQSNSETEATKALALFIVN